MIIQPFTSRLKTLRVNLSNEAYRYSGTEIFSSEKIPFGDKTSQDFAEKIVKLFTSRIRKLKEEGETFTEGVHIYELGAGTGILAKRILDLLKQQSPDIYNKIVLHISDISKPMISELKSSGIFRKYSKHAILEVIDATNPKFRQKPFFVYFTNLIDPVPHRHIKTVNGGIFEIQIQTSLKENSQIVDATVYPPKVLNESQIAGLLTSDGIKKRVLLAPKLLDVLTEETKELPIEKVSDITKVELKDLKNCVEYAKGTRSFNYSHQVNLALQKIIQALKRGGFILVSDFGTASKGFFPQSLLLEIGTVVAFPVDFLVLEKITRKAGTISYLTSKAPGHPQEMLIDTLPNQDQIQYKFEALFNSNDILENVHSFLKKIKLTLFSPQDRQWKLKTVVNLYNELSSGEKRDYQLLNDLAFFLLQTGFYQDAKIFADILEENYKNTAGIYYYIVKGKAEQELGNYKKAEAIFKKAVLLKKGFLAYAYLADLYLLLEKPKQYLITIKEYLKYTRNKDYLKSMFCIATTFEKLSKPKHMQKTLSQLINLGDKLKNLSDSEQEILKEAKSLLSPFLDLPPKKWSTNSIVFASGKQFTKWDPAGLDNPGEAFLGGSEEAVICLARALNKLGWEVTVYAEPAKEGVYDGVRWRNYHKFNPKDEFNILIYWRSIRLTEMNCLARQTYLWCHDVQVTSNYTQKKLSKLNKIIVLSESHRKNLPQLSEDRFMILSNGYYENFPEIKTDNNPDWCIWTSSYDRGLEHLLNIWPDVIKAVPKAQLHIFYGWQIFDVLHSNERPYMQWKEEMIKAMDQPGIIHHGRVSQKELEKWYKKCGIFAYPCHFYEISCISAMKAQAFGAVPITTATAALNETVQFGVKIKGDIWEESVKENYKKALIQALKDHKWQASQRIKMMDWAKNKFSWANIAKSWSDHLYSAQ